MLVENIVILPNTGYNIQNERKLKKKYFTEYTFFISVLRTYGLVGRPRPLKCGRKLVAICRQSRPRVMWWAFASKIPWWYLSQVDRHLSCE